MAKIQRLERAWEIIESDLTLGRVLAAGSFGTVYQAHWGHIEVAVKVLKYAIVDGDTDPMATDDFDREVTFMQGGVTLRWNALNGV